MAEGLQKKIEYADLQFISAFAMEKILDFQTWEIPGEHARGNFRLLLSENETGINSMNAPIRLCGQDNSAGALFSGYPEKVEIKEEGRYRIADIQAVSGTILLDQKKCNRVFQKKAQTYMGIANTVTADTEHSACILPGRDMQTGGTLIQYQETDWSFLKRMASQLGLPLVPDTSYYYPRFYFGLPEGEKRELGEILSCDMCFDGRYYAVSGKCLVDREDFICYDVVTRTNLSLGDRVTCGGRELLVSRKKTELVRGEVIFTYRLAGSSYTWVPWEDNPDYTGMSFVGSIVGTQGEQVEVAFDIDQTAAGGNRYGFAPATGNLMYCMPQKGTKTALYIGNGDEAQGIATGCIRTNGSTCEGTGSPEKKSFRSEHGKGMDLYPQSMGLDGGETGKITFEDETGTTIESNGGLVLMAKEGIRLESMTGIAMQGMSDIMALYSEGASSLCVNGSVDMLGMRTGLAGTVYHEYAPYEDAPQKGEFDWGGFARNLVMGLAVGAACIALAVFLPGIGTVAAGALFGAGMGAISASVVGAVNDYSSGNVRSLGEATKDMVISMITGAITGAIGAAFPAIKWFGEGLIDVGSGILTRGMYALLNPDMSAEEKLAYVFDLKQMGVDFITGVTMHFASKGVSAVREKLPWNKSGSIGGMCFVKGTLIWTDGGNKPIECIQIGDRVYSRNMDGGKKGYKDVINVYKNSTEILIKIIIDNVLIETTESHRFFTLNKGWVVAQQLTLNDKLVDAQGILHNIQAISRIVLKEALDVYNFEVEDWHTYFVSEKAILVHNDCSIGANKWHKGSFDSPDESLVQHFKKHGMEVGANDVEQYLRKAEEFSRNLRGARKAHVPGATPGVVRYYKNGKYIDMVDGKIISFGKQ